MSTNKTIKRDYATTVKQKVDMETNQTNKKQVQEKSVKTAQGTKTVQPLRPPNIIKTMEQHVSKMQSVGHIIQRTHVSPTSSTQLNDGVASAEVAQAAD